ncbi:alpha/beta hydrolase fold [Amycolatopsis marina]|uniref:Alpha/beta hydrolase fold n=1 Tax=Amycolatopsis marina TaxID=490629 RepID=A0A1I1B9K1_9PSEU|nr:alpha/beta hydrolase [Amycolatopsis marina]SFB45203.1 alpha/beta hydrolase fold [Amycolatopsis marina]
MRRGFTPAPRGRGRGPAPVVVLTVVAAILTGCTAGPSSRPAVVENDGPPPSQEPAAETEIPPLPPLRESNSSSVQWSPCDADTRQRLGSPAVPDSLEFSCALVNTTVDAPDLPRRGLARIAVLKVGDGPIPLAVVNDVDGEPGTLYAARLAASLPPAVLERFSLIGMDRRGTGQSDPVVCVPPEIRSGLLGHDPATENIEPLLETARTAGQQCTITLENEQTAIDSWRAAGDLEELRDQLGVEHLHALSHGEGSNVLTAYGERFPDRVGRFVLDGVPDPSHDLAATLDGIAAGALKTLDAFAEDCARRGCPLGDDVRAALTDLGEQLRTRPLFTSTGTPMGAGLALHATLRGLGQPERWAELATALDAARSGDGTKLASFLEPMLNDTRAAPARLDAALATWCNDTSTRLPADRIDQVVTDMAGKYPVFGGLVAQRLAWCGPWPVRREAAPDPSMTGVPPIVVASTAADPVTPERGTIRAAEQMRSAVRVAWQGAGHGALESSCVAGAVEKFLVDGVVPDDGTLCPA